MIIGRSPARSISRATRPAGAPTKSVGDYRVVGHNAPRVDLAGEGVRRAGLHPRHGARRHGACARRAPAAPRRDDRVGRRGRSAARGQRADRDRARRQFPRDRRRRTKPSSRPSRRSRRTMSSGTASIRSTRFRKRRAGCCSSPRSTGSSAPRPDLIRRPARAVTRRPTRGCTSPMPRSRHPAASPSIATGGSRCGPIRKGVYPLRDALARTLKLDPAAISVKHVQGPGCYGHNGADDAAADAAVIALRTAGQAGPGALAARGGVRLRAGQPGDGGDGARRARRRRGGPADWTTEIWSGRHTSRPGGGGNLLAAEALPDPPPRAARSESSYPPGAGTRNGEPLYAFPPSASSIT